MLLHPLLATITIFAHACTSQMERPTDNCPKKVTLKVGESLSVKLPANESTGFIWIPRVDPLIVWDAKDKFEPEPSRTKPGEEPLVGTGSTQILTATGVKVGKGRILLEYRRPFGPPIILDTCSIELHVLP